MSSEEHPLSKAFSADMTPENLDKARKDVDRQISRSPKPPVTEEEEPEEEPEEEAKEDAEEETADETPDSKGEPEPVEYVADLNNVSDVLVILVGKYSRLSKLLYICMALLVIGVGLIVKAGFEIDHLQASQVALQEEMRKATAEVADAKQAVKDTGDAVKDTTEAVKEAAEAAPKAVYDADAGTAKIVIPVLKCKGDPKDCEKRTPEPKEQPKPKSGGKGGGAPPAAGLKSPQQTVPLNPRVDLQDEDGASF